MVYIHVVVRRIRSTHLLVRFRLVVMCDGRIALAPISSNTITSPRSTEPCCFCWELSRLGISVRQRLGMLIAVALGFESSVVYSGGGWEQSDVLVDSRVRSALPSSRSPASSA